MAVRRGSRTCFIWPWTIVLRPDAKPIDFAHEIAHALLYRKGFCISWANAKGWNEIQYEALVWSVAAKFVKDEYWDIDYIKEKIYSHGTDTDNV
jgi:hypothetical protein